MKKPICITAVIVALTLPTLVQASLRTVSVGDTITVRYSGLNYRTGSGGEFQLGKVNAPSNPDYFHTFCAETGESLGGSSQQYYVQSLGFSSISQGGSLTEGTAKLYRDYYDSMASLGYGYQGVSGTTYTGPGDNSLNFALMGGFTFDMADNTTRRSSGQSVQNVLWNMLGYGTALNAAETAMRDAYAALDGSGDFSGVRIANLVFEDDRSRRAQDQFVVVPEASTIAIWTLLGLCGLAGYRRWLY